MQWAKEFHFHSRVNLVNMPAVILFCRCQSFSNGMYLILEMKLLKPHSKCYTVRLANYTEEFWRYFLSTLVCQSFLPPPPFRSLRIISFPTIHIPFPEWIWSVPSQLSQLPFKNFFPPPVAIFKGRWSLWPVGLMLVWLFWQWAKNWCQPSSPSFPDALIHSTSRTNCPFIVKDCLTPPTPPPFSGFQLWPVLCPIIKCLPHI